MVVELHDVAVRFAEKGPHFFGDQPTEALCRRRLGPEVEPGLVVRLSGRSGAEVSGVVGLEERAKRGARVEIIRRTSKSADTLTNCGRDEIMPRTPETRDRAVASSGKRITGSHMPQR